VAGGCVAVVPGGGWINHGGGWINHSGGWINRRGGWVNRSSGGSAGWINRGGGSGVGSIAAAAAAGSTEAAAVGITAGVVGTIEGVAVGIIAAAATGTIVARRSLDESAMDWAAMGQDRRGVWLAKWAKVAKGDSCFNGFAVFGAFARKSVSGLGAFLYARFWCRFAVGGIGL
jgi:hypothetical protein